MHSKCNASRNARKGKERKVKKNKGGCRGILFSSFHKMRKPLKQHHLIPQKEKNCMCGRRLAQHKKINIKNKAPYLPAIERSTSE